MQRFIYLSAALLLLLNPACRRETPVTPPVEELPTWTPVEGFAGMRADAYYSAVWDDQLYVLSGASLSTVSPEGAAYHYSLGGPGQNRRVYFNKNFVPMLWSEPNGSDDFISFWPSANVTTANAKRAHLRLRDLGADITGYDRFISYSRVGIDADDRLLLPLKTQSGADALFLFEVKTSRKYAWTDVDTVLVTRIEVPGMQLVDRINLIGENFLVSYFGAGSGGTLLVRPNGQFQQASSDQVWHAFPYSDAWYAAGIKGAYRSGDQGNSWTNISPNAELLGGPVVNNLRGHLTVNGRLLLYTADALYWLSPDANGGFSARKLALDGLGQGAITSVTAWRDHLYITTQQSGVFRAALADLD